MWIWDDYEEITRGRKGDGLGSIPSLTQAMLYYWQWNNQVRLPVAHQKLLFRLDAAFLKELLTPLQGGKENAE
jgi:hypothetical protein